MLNVSIKKWVNYYLELDNLNINFLKSFIIFLSKLKTRDIYLEHSFSNKNWNISRFRWLVALSNLHFTDFDLVLKYYKNLVNYNQYKFLLNKIENLYNWNITFQNIIFWFDQLDRIKFYYTTSVNNIVKTDFDHKDIICWYDFTIDWNIIEKSYLILYYNEIIKNKIKLIDEFWEEIYNLFLEVEQVNIAYKNNELSIDFKIDNNIIIFNKLVNVLNIDFKENISWKFITFLGVNYLKDKKEINKNNFNIYFY